MLQPEIPAATSGRRRRDAYRFLFTTGPHASGSGGTCRPNQRETPQDTGRPFALVMKTRLVTRLNGELDSKRHRFASGKSRIPTEGGTQKAAGRFSGQGRTKSAGKIGRKMKVGCPFTDSPTRCGLIFRSGQDLHPLLRKSSGCSGSASADRHLAGSAPSTPGGIFGCVSHARLNPEA